MTVIYRMHRIPVLMPCGRPNIRQPYWEKLDIPLRSERRSGSFQSWEFFVVKIKNTFTFFSLKGLFIYLKYFRFKLL